MKYTEELKSYVNKIFSARLQELGELGREYEGLLAVCGEEESLLLRFVLGTLPLSDLGDYPAEYFLEETRHSLFLRHTVPWCMALPEAEFLLYVLCPRINNEELRPCRKFFYEEIYPRVSGLSAEEAILEVNRWCAEQATYRTTDNRTAAPLAVYHCGYGRCGEESAFLTAALRSVGLAARQVYAPLWSHCDDNHAWVEAYHGEAWKFLGACEPEPVLNLGWFTHAASRAMLELTRTFAPGTREEISFLFSSSAPEDLLPGKGVVYVNVTAGYAETRKVSVLVQDEEGNPVPHVEVAFHVLNMAELGRLLSVPANGEGRAVLNLGLGSVLAVAERDGKRGETLFLVGEQAEIVLVLGAYAPEQRGEFDFSAPEDSPKNRISLAPAQKDRRSQTLRRAAELREHKKRLTWNHGNNRQEEKALSLLTEKDLAFSLRPGVLEDAARAWDYREKLPPEIWEQGLLTQRIGLEPLTPWRAAIEKRFTAEEAEGCRREPEQIRSWIAEHVKTDEKSYAALSPTPEGILRIGAASPAGKNTLFVAICRALGIPARLSPVDREPEYWRDGSYHRQQVSVPMGILTVSAPKDRPGLYAQSWTAARRIPGGYEALELEDIPAGETEKFTVAAGEYRLITTARLPGGGQLAKKWEVTLGEGEEAAVSLSLREIRTEDLLGKFDMPRISVNPLSEKNREKLTGPAVVCWLEPSREPTEHILNELQEAAEAYEEAGLLVEFIVDGKEALSDRTLENALKKLPKAGLWQGDFGTDGPMLARRLYVDPERLPLIYLLDGEGNARYACCGYNVGTAELLLSMAKKLK